MEINITKINLNPNVGGGGGGKSQLPNGIRFKGSVMGTFTPSDYNWEGVVFRTSMFAECSGLEGLDFTGANYSLNASDLSYFVSNCSNLKFFKLGNAPLNKITKTTSMFSSCQNLTDVDLSNINGTSLTTLSSMFYSCYELKNLKFIPNIKESFAVNNSGKLSNESIDNILQCLYNFTEAGETPTSTQAKVTFGSTNLAKLTDEQKTFATSKGWTLA